MRRVLALIEDGYRDWEDMAEELDVSATMVRRDVQKMCEHFDCRMGELPERVESAAA